MEIKKRFTKNEFYKKSYKMSPQNVSNNNNEIEKRFFIYNPETKEYFMNIGSGYSNLMNLDLIMLSNNWSKDKVYNIYFDSKKIVRYPTGKVEVVYDIEKDFYDYEFEDSLDYCGYILQIYQNDWLIDYPKKFIEKVGITKSDGTIYTEPLIKSVFNTVEFIKNADLDDLACMGI